MTVERPGAAAGGGFGTTGLAGIGSWAAVMMEGAPGVPPVTPPLLPAACTYGFGAACKYKRPVGCGINLLQTPSGLANTSKVTPPLLTP